MLFCLYSAKGGSGVTVAAAALAIAATGGDSSLGVERPPVTLVDLAGDLAGVLGIETGPGVSEWLAASDDVPIAALARLAVPVVDGLELIRTGAAVMESPAGARARVLAEILCERAESAPVVVDCGLLEPGDTLGRALVARAGARLLVTRPCYLALSRASRLAHNPTGVVLIDEPGRALRAQDVESVVGAPVVARVPLDPLVARAVDCGLFARRAPRSVRRAMSALLGSAAVR